MVFYTTQLGVQRAAGFGGISLVQMKGADSDWMGMTNKYGQAWEVPVTPKLPWCGPALAGRACCLCLWQHANLLGQAHPAQVGCAPLHC